MFQSRPPHFILFFEHPSALKKAFALQSKPTDVSTKLKEGTKAAEEAERFANEGATGVHDKS